MSFLTGVAVDISVRWRATDLPLAYILCAVKEKKDTQFSQSRNASYELVKSIAGVEIEESKNTRQSGRKY